MTATLSVLTDQGTAMAEATLCPAHHADPVLRGYAEIVAAGADDAPPVLAWADSTGNDAVACVECGVQS